MTTQAQAQTANQRAHPFRHACQLGVRGLAVLLPRARLRSRGRDAALLDPEPAVVGVVLDVDGRAERHADCQLGQWNNIRITVSDGTSSSSALRFSIRAARRDNVAPVISGTPATSVAVGSAYRFVPTASDENRDPLRFSISNRPAWATFSSATGALSGTPTAANVGTYSNIQIRVSDGKLSVGLAPFTITVTGSANRAPTISGTPSTSVTAGQAYSFRPTAADADNNTLGFSIQNRPTWATFSSVTGQLSGTPTATNVGTYSNIVISVSDGKTSTALAPFSITVANAPNRAPTISGTPSTSVNAGSAFAFRPTAADADGDTLTFAIANRPAWATFNAATGQLAGTPTATSAGTYSNIVISVSDGTASAALAAFSIAVVDVSNGAATLSWTPPTTNTDGSTLTTLAGYRIAYGTSAAHLTQTIQLGNAGVSSYVVENLAPGTYYFAVRAYTSERRRERELECRDEDRAVSRRNVATFM